MRVRLPRLLGFCMLIIFILGACVNPTTMSPVLSITLGAVNDERGITLDQGEDVDTLPVNLTSEPAGEIRRSGNGEVLASADGNSTPDFYLQFNVDDIRLRRGIPTAHVRVEVDYFDIGNDSFTLQYDALSGMFASGGRVVKTDTYKFTTAKFNLCDANFDNRDNGADFRISDGGDGTEFIHAVRVIGLTYSMPHRVFVDDFGANPFDNRADSRAIQTALDSACSGDTITFTSPGNNPAYRGYLIDKTLFLTGTSAKHNLRFTSSVLNDHARLRATATLKGYVVRLYARSRFSEAGAIDNIDFGNIDVDGGRGLRKCSGADLRARPDGHDDNWGSWLPGECRVTAPPESADPWCLPGNIAMDGGMDWNDVTQNYRGNPAIWTTGVVVHDVLDQGVECGTALSFFSAAGAIRAVTVDTAGDHSHSDSCPLTDNDGDQEGWADGITFSGPGHTVQFNNVVNASDVGIVFFGGKDTTISTNLVETTDGYGMFAGIAVHPWILGDISGTQVVGNQVESVGDAVCGGMHAGINLGPHMWGSGCRLENSSRASYGNNGSCSMTPSLADVRPCTGASCQVWAYLPSGSTFTMRDNIVTGAHINYLVEGFAILGRFIDENNISRSPQRSDWHAARIGCPDSSGVRWVTFHKVAHDPSLPGYINQRIQCER